jgi:hypothetical protein
MSLQHQKTTDHGQLTPQILQRSFCAQVRAIGLLDNYVSFSSQYASLNETTILVIRLS